MARSISEIYNQMITAKEADSNLTSLDSTSQTAIWRLFFYISAVSISFLEQILDLFKVEIEAKLLNKVSGTTPWIRENILLFQYSSTVPQIVEIDSDWNISYPTPDTSLQIVTQAAIEVQSNNIVKIKVAKSTVPEPLETAELVALNQYLTEIMPAGIAFRTISVASDKIYFNGTVYYNGLYSSTIQASVEAAITDYLNNLPFGGKYVHSELEHAIISVAGVRDVYMRRVQARRDETTFDVTGNTPIYILEGTGDDLNNRYYYSYAGYLVPEDTTNWTMSDSIRYVVQ